MDSTPNPPHPQPQPQPRTLSIKARARKLPIKRKIPDSSPNPNPNSIVSPIVVPKLESAGEDIADDDGEDDIGGGDQKLPPFKFHRIWTEPDEIRFLQGLIDCSSEGLSFPRDLSVFYARFSGTMSQPYTKSQLSEKLRRLRKKFRVISSRIARGLDEALLSPHDRDLFELSKRLWHPEFSSTSPFGANSTPKKSNLVGVKVSFSPSLPSTSVSNQTTIKDSIEHISMNWYDSGNDDHGGDGNVKLNEASIDGDAKLSEVNIEVDDGVREQQNLVPTGSNGWSGGSSVGLEQVVGKTALDVFDQSLRETRMILVHQGLLNPDHGAIQIDSSNEGKSQSFEKRWREQQFAELDVFSRRLRLVLEHSLQRQ